MKNIITLLLNLFITTFYGQVTYTEVPLDRQLVGRDIATNIGDVIIKGEVNKTGAAYDKVVVEIYRAGVLHNTVAQNLIFTANRAPFSFNIPIAAELVNYSVKIYGESAGVKKLDKEVIDLVAGDVYIIQGQSNAEAKKHGSLSANSNQSNFIRVYARGTGAYKDDFWYIGQGDGSNSSDGNTGQWGLKLAKMLVDDLKIPIAIFNGAEGGEKIDYFLSHNSNYADLYNRLNKTGLENKVKALFWSQGGQDAGEGTSLEKYKKSFLSLKSNWLNDYPTIEKFYIFQSKKSSNYTVFEIQEAQRQLAFENSNVLIMSTAALNHVDSSHFGFSNGYEEFAKRIFPLIKRDIYGVTATVDIDAPMIQSARLVNATTIEVVTDAAALSIATVAEDFVLEDANQEDLTSAITNISIVANKIIFKLSENLGENTTISYIAQEVGVTGNFITNSNGLEIVCFYRYPVVIGGLNVDDENLKNNFTIVSEENNLLIKSDTEINQIKVYDITGRLLIDKQPQEKEFRINIQSIRKGTVLILKSIFENGVETSKRAIKY